MKIYMLTVSYYEHDGIEGWDHEKCMFYSSLDKAKEYVDGVTINEIIINCGGDDAWNVDSDERWADGDILYGRFVSVGDKNDDIEECHCFGNVSFIITEREVIE